jgi:8-oxo-dGTP pyrophosphatase MutT (NUDIX family)
MHITIYSVEKPIILIEKNDLLLENYIHNPTVLLMDEITHGMVHTAMHEIKKPEISAIVISAEDIGQLKTFFFKHFTIIQAAGGLVENKKGEWLIIFRRGKWDLPKGKIDEGETPKICAVREIEEETGLRDVKIIHDITTTYHLYEEFGKQILKETFWYRMQIEDDQTLVPQAEEDIEQVKWIAPYEWDLYSNQSYASIREVIALTPRQPDNRTSS